jgi:hypothetical protein
MEVKTSTDVMSERLKQQIRRVGGRDGVMKMR